MKTKTLHPTKHWVKLGKLEGAPDGTFYLDKVKCTTDPETGAVWIFVDDHREQLNQSYD